MNRKGLLSLLLVIFLLADLVALTYTVVTPYPSDAFTDFYILGPQGEATGYPEILPAGTESSVIIGIVNHEKEEVTYRLEIVLDGQTLKVISPIIVPDDYRWEQAVSFTPRAIGEQKRVEFLLYNDDNPDPLSEPLHRLHLWMDVVEPDHTNPVASNSNSRS